MIIKELGLGECRAVLAEMGLGRLACARDNQPYALPIHFAYDGRNYLYVFSTLGQKIEWMRSNPLVCVEVEKIHQQNDWTTLIIFGEYEELSDTQQFSDERARAFDLLSRQPMWWEPAFVEGAHRTPSENAEPIYFRIRISEMTGHRAVVDDTETGRKTEQAEGFNWLRRLWHFKQ